MVNTLILLKSWLAQEDVLQVEVNLLYMRKSDRNEARDFMIQIVSFPLDILKTTLLSNPATIDFLREESISYFMLITRNNKLS